VLRRLRGTLVAALVLGVALARAHAGPPPAGIVQSAAAGVVVDWSAGTIAAPGVAAADLRAPNIEVARVGAERQASERAREALAKAVRALPLAGGGTAGARLDADAHAAGRLAAALAHARALDVSYAADGGARVLLALPLEAVRAALAPGEPPADDPAAPTAIVIDAQRLGLHPGLGLRLAAAGGAPLALPTVWQPSKQAADADVRAGGRRATALATGFDKGVLTVDLDAKMLESAARAGALIVVVVGVGAGEGAKK
jgi:hypothetical protein